MTGNCAGSPKGPSVVVFVRLTPITHSTMLTGRATSEKWMLVRRGATGGNTVVGAPESGTGITACLVGPDAGRWDPARYQV